MIDEEAERKIHLVGGTSWATPKRWLVIMNVKQRLYWKKIYGYHWGKSSACELWSKACHGQRLGCTF
jgi:hypothetical protein